MGQLGPTRGLALQATGRTSRHSEVGPFARRRWPLNRASKKLDYFQSGRYTLKTPANPMFLRISGLLHPLLVQATPAGEFRWSRGACPSRSPPGSICSSSSPSKRESGRAGRRSSPPASSAHPTGRTSSSAGSASTASRQPTPPTRAVRNSGVCSSCDPPVRGLGPGSGGTARHQPDPQRPARRPGRSTREDPASQFQQTATRRLPR